MSSYDFDVTFGKIVFNASHAQEVFVFIIVKFILVYYKKYEEYHIKIPNCEMFF